MEPPTKSQERLNPTTFPRYKGEGSCRTATGASVVGIERGGTSIINPGPDEELLPGDQLLLLGHIDQIGKAKSLLTGENQVTPA